MKIYTRTGDTGETSLFGGGRVPKSDRRVSAYGDVDELNALLGQAHTHLQTWTALRDQIAAAQRVLFGIGGELATPSEKGRDKLRDLVQEEDAAALEASIDEMEKELPALTGFILPGGGEAGAALHVARTVCRRAERAVVGLGQEVELRPEIVRYLNRLSDWLFVLARYVNWRERHPETPW
ncbi:MAG: ATP--cob(I)alamin adenosyltransferase [Gemmatimonadota bacterium]|nr:MAG: ATP--cob(I)alamin adenosyltransferase [Gemmatimonadota bacterium]